MDLTFSTAAILSFVPAMSLIINVRFNHNENVKQTKRHQRDLLQNYSVDLIGTLWDYADLEVRYLTERLAIQEKMAKHESIDPAHSQFVYGMKNDLMQMQTELRRKVWNSQIEISKYDFPKMRNRVAKTFLAINVHTKPFELDNLEDLDEVKIKVLEANLAREIKDLTKDFGKQADRLTLEIRNANLYYDIKNFLESSRQKLSLGSTKKKHQNEAAYAVFGETTRLQPTTEKMAEKAVEKRRSQKVKSKKINR